MKQIMVHLLQDRKHYLLEPVVEGSSEGRYRWLVDIRGVDLVDSVLLWHFFSNICSVADKALNDRQKQAGLETARKLGYNLVFDEETVISDAVIERIFAVYRKVNNRFTSTHWRDD